MCNPSEVLIVPNYGPSYCAVIHTSSAHPPQPRAQLHPTAPATEHPTGSATGTVIHRVPMPIPRPLPPQAYSDGVSFGFVLLLVAMIAAACIMTISIFAIFSPRQLGLLLNRWFIMEH
jgi:hypothetical protein